MINSTLIYIGEVSRRVSLTEMSTGYAMLKLPVISELDRKWMGVIEILMRWETGTWQSYIGRVT